MNIISCNLILFPPVIEEEDAVIREAKLAQAAKNIRKRKCMFDMADVERICEHEDKRFCMVYFYYTDPIVIEFSYDELQRVYLEEHQDQQDDDSSSGQEWVFFTGLN
jgi:hypothetical protein